MANLTANGVLDMLGIPRSACIGTVTLGGSEGVFSSRPNRSSLAQPHHVQLTSLDPIRSLVGGHVSAAASIPQPWPSARSGAAISDLNQAEENDLRRALFAHVLGHGDETASYRDVVAKRFLPLHIIVYTGKEIVIKNGETLRIEPDGHDPVVVNYEKVTLEEGGHIRCEAPVLMIVEKFIKKKSAATK